MQPVRWSHRLARVGIFWLVAATFALAGCSSAAPIPIVGPLVTVEVQGGMCMEGACDNSVVLERDGRVHRPTTQSAAAEELGRVSADAYAALDLAIRSTDFAAVKSKPFTGECPIAFDGQKLIFTFAVAATTQKVDSCESAIDWGSPLFIAITNALGEWIPIPFS